MKKNYNHNLGEELKTNYKNHFIAHSSKTKPSLINKKQYEFISQKSSLETLLNLIKNCQLNCVNKTINNKSTFNIKSILLSLKNDLNLKLNKKNKKYENLKIQNDIKKKEIQNLIFPDTEKTVKNEKNNMDNKNNYKSDINQLQILNFQLENEINNTDSLITQKNLIIFTIKFSENNQNEIIYLNNNYINIAKVTYLLHNNIIEKRATFIDTVKEKYDKEVKIKLLLSKISDLKFKIKNNEKYNTQSIITEVSKEYIKSSKITDDSIILNKNTETIKKKKSRSNKLVNKNILYINPEKYKRKKYIYYEALSPKIVNNLTNNIKNYLNNKYNVNNSHSNDDKINNKKYVSNNLHTFNSSLDSNNLSCTFNNQLMIQELEELGLFQNGKINNKLLYQTDDNSNTNNSNNSSNKNNNINNYHNSYSTNENEKKNQDDNYIFL